MSVTVKIEDNLFVRPTLSYSGGATGVGCFSRVLQGFSVCPGPMMDAEGNTIPSFIQLTPADRDYYEYRYSGYRKSSEAYHRISGMFNAAGGYPEDQRSSWKIQSFPQHNPTKGRELIDAACENSWESLKGLNASMIVFGDAVSDKASSGLSRYVAKWITDQAKTGRDMGVLSASHMVVNQNHPTAPRYCQVWCWTPPQYAPMATTRKSLEFRPKRKTDHEVLEAVVARFQPHGYHVGPMNAPEPHLVGQERKKKVQKEGTN